jgi:hypothetical protein
VIALNKKAGFVRGMECHPTGAAAAFPGAKSQPSQSGINVTKRCRFASDAGGIRRLDLQLLPDEAIV